MVTCILGHMHIIHMQETVISLRISPSWPVGLPSMVVVLYAPQEFTSTLLGSVTGNWKENKGLTELLVRPTVAMLPTSIRYTPADNPLLGVSVWVCGCLEISYPLKDMYKQNVCLNVCSELTKLALPLSRFDQIETLELNNSFS